MANRKRTPMIRGQVTKSPFSKKLLIRSLINSGLRSNVAEKIADKVKLRLKEMEASSITKSELREIVHEIITQEYGKKFAKHYPSKESLDYDVIVEGKGGKLPYSKGIMSQSLMACGLSPTTAYEAARSIEMKLKSNRIRSISREKLRKMTYDILVEEISDEHAERYLLWRRMKSPEKPLIITIGGATGVGKSTIASEVAYRLGITHIICTDVIRAVMREMIPASLLPAIHASSYSVAETLTVPLPPQTDPVLIGFTEQVSRIATGIEAAVERAAEENVSTLIEGVHVIPRPPRESEDIHEITIMIAVRDSDAHKARFCQRYEENERRPMTQYLSHFKAIRRIQDHIIRLAEKYNIPVIDNVNLDEAVDIAMEEVTSEVEKIFAKMEAAKELAPANA